MNAIDLEDYINDWQFWCPNQECRNRTYTIIAATEKDLPYGEERGDKRYLTVRVLECARCKHPVVLGTYTYYNPEKEWGARGYIKDKLRANWPGLSPAIPLEFLAFQEPTSKTPLPKSVPKKTMASFYEAEDAVIHRRPIGAAAAIRNTVRLLVEAERLDSTNLKEAVKKLPLKQEYIRAVGNLKIVGDQTLHYEEFALPDLVNAVRILGLSIISMYDERESLALLEKAVGDKASKHGKVT